MTYFKNNCFFLICVFSFSSFALKESNISFVYDLLDKKEFYQTGEFIGEKGVKLQYARFGKTRGKNGALVFVNGRAENLFKYIELFYDLYLKGWSPIYTYDHRGQGFSSRLSSNVNIGSIDSYSYYRKDLKTFFGIVKKDSQLDPNNLFLISHSMGGLIAVDYLYNYGSSGIKALVLSAPMFQIKIGVRSGFDYISSLYCAFFFCLTKKNNENRSGIFTHSNNRETFFMYLEKERFPQSKLGPPSLSWVIKSFKASYTSMNKTKTQKIKIPLLVLQAEKEALVSNKHQEKFCKNLSGYCELKSYPGKHELFIEKDSIRNQVLADVSLFFLQQK